MLHAIVGLLDNSAHIDSYMAHDHGKWCGWALSYIAIHTASDKHPEPEKGLAIQDQILCTCIVQRILSS